MDLGLAGRTAVVCASSQGLGRACATELARAGCTVVINGRDAAKLERTAEEIRQETGATVIPVAADLDSADGPTQLVAAVPAVDILVNNNGGPPPRDFRQVDEEALLAGVAPTWRPRSGWSNSSSTAWSSAGSAGSSTSRPRR